LLNTLEPKHVDSDGAEFIRYLLEKEYDVYYEVDKEQTLELVIYCSAFQKEMTRKYGQVMFFDTICGTNKYNHVRGTVTIQLNNGRTMPVLFSILPNQNTETFKKYSILD